MSQLIVGICLVIVAVFWEIIGLVYRVPGATKLSIGTIGLGICFVIGVLTILSVLFGR